MALEDTAASSAVSFGWTEGAALAVAVTQSSGSYSITVTSLKEPDITNAHDDDEDDLP